MVSTVSRSVSTIWKDIYFVNDLVYVFDFLFVCVRVGV